jgi:hypothetical protein
MVMRCFLVTGMSKHALDRHLVWKHAFQVADRSNHFGGDGLLPLGCDTRELKVQQVYNVLWILQRTGRIPYPRRHGTKHAVWEIKKIGAGSSPESELHSNRRVRITIVKLALTVLGFADGPNLN